MFSYTAILLFFLVILKLFIGHNARIAPSSQFQNPSKIRENLPKVIFSITYLREARSGKSLVLSFLAFNKTLDVRSRKEVFQPHLPVRLPCYDLAPITGITLGRPLRSRTSGAPGFHGLTGGVYKARERIHRAMADARLLANPASWSRVADSNPN